MRLSNGSAGKPAFDHAQLAPATKIADADAVKLLARATALPPAPTATFALRPRSQPAPRTGAVQTQSFPPDASTLLPPPAATATGALAVARYMPEGKVPLAPQLSVTFSQPMIAVTSQDDAAAIQPVVLSPQPKGRWRWIGTRTIVFDPDVRFPQATTYHVEIPAGTKAAGGSALAAATKFTFETPPPTVVSSSPNDTLPQRIDVPMFVVFDQKIDAQAMLASIRVTANGTAQRVRMLDAAEIEKDKSLRLLVAAAHANEQDGRWIAFRATAPLPADAAIHVEVASGAPSAEGSTRPAAQSYEFRTYPPLRIERAECGAGSECPPNVPFAIELTNPIDEAKLRDEQITVSPAIPNMQTVAQGRNILLIGPTTARTHYTLKVAAGIADVFGQTLASGGTYDIAVGDAQPTFYGPSGVVVLDPAATKPTLDVFSTNYPQLKVRLFKVAPSDYDAYRNYVANQWNHDHPPPTPGEKVFDKLIDTTEGANKLVETHVDLSTALGAHGLGHAVAIIEPSPWKETYEPPRLIVWAQSTKLAVDAHLDSDSLVAMTTDLATGKPIADAQLEPCPPACTRRATRRAWRRCRCRSRRRARTSCSRGAATTSRSCRRIAAMAMARPGRATRRSRSSPGT